MVEDSAGQRGPVATAALESVSPSESQSLKKQEAYRISYWGSNRHSFTRYFVLFLSSRRCFSINPFHPSQFTSYAANLIFNG